MRNILAAATNCPNCRNPLSEHERIEAPVIIPRLNLTDLQDDLFLAPEPIPTLRLETSIEMLESLYAWPLSDYIYNRVEKTGVHHQAAYSTVFTSLLTVQAVLRGGLVRSRLRRASNSV